MRNVVRQTGLFSAALIVVLCSATIVIAQTPTSYTSLSDPGTAGGTLGHGSKLNVYDSVLIEAPVAKDLPSNATSTAVCYSIGNQTGLSYFIPWNTPKEWSAFLDAIAAGYQLNLEHVPLTPLTTTPVDNRWVKNVSIATCCPEQQVGIICQGANGTISSNAELGYRYKDMPGGDVANWGADGDVYGPVYAAQISGDSSINYQVTFVCSGGQWIKTHAEGSCVPQAGQCATGSGGLKALPSDLTTLCAAGSVFDPTSLKGPSGGPWTWNCLGTPGQAMAACSTGPTDGACGAQNGQPFAGWGGVSGPYGGSGGNDPSQNLCANGTTPSAVTGPDVNTFKVTDGNTGTGVTNYVQNLFHWTCSGTQGSNVTASCSAPDSAGICALSSWVNYGMSGSDGTTPAGLDNFLCLEGSPSAVTHGPSTWGGSYAQFQAWNWYCTNGGSQYDYCSRFDDAAPMPGGCGGANNVIVTSSTVPPNTNLCDGNSVLASGPTYVPVAPGGVGVGYWTWTCQGNNGGSIAQCGADYDPNPAVCGPWVPYSTPPTNPQLLCAGGTPTPDTGLPLPVSNGNYWIWNCTGASGNSIPCSAPIEFDGSCGTAQGVTSVGSPTYNLCGLGSGAANMVQNGNTWSWQCVGNWGGAIVLCTAPVGVAPPLVVGCGPASGQSTPNMPSGGTLCSSGAFATNITDNGNGLWTWTCESGSSAPAFCTAPNPVSGPGVCGTSNNKSIPDIPDTNLCFTGAPSAVTGTGPWNWSCIGQGPDAGQNMDCLANICTASGTIVTSQTTSTVSGTYNGCAVTGYASWTETDTVIPDNSPVTLSWNDPFYNTFTKVITPTQPPPPYCSPRYASPQSVSNVQVTVTATHPRRCSDPSLHKGNPVVITPTNITLSNSP